MKNIFIITHACLLIFYSLILTSCHGGQADYDLRLNAADSMLHQAPDSALTLLTSMNNKDLKGQNNRAYHSLLLTQARYKCYVTATDDSAINAALEYYRRHDSEVEKLTRAYLYKGAVMEELGDVTAAMKYYKQALAQASPDDYFNQGYCRLRMGHLYRDYIVADSTDIELFKEAKRQFEQLPDSFYILTCLSCLGGSYIKNNQDSALYYLELANSMAKRLHQRAIEQKVLIHLADIKMFSKDSQNIATAKGIALNLLNAKDSPTDRKDHLIMLTACCLAKENKPDSALYYLNQVDATQLSPNMMVMHGKCLAELARCRGDFDGFQRHFEQFRHLADSLVTDDMQRQLRDTEAKYDNEALKYKTLEYRDKWIISLLLASLAICSLAIGFMVFRRRLSRRKQQLLSQEAVIERLRSDTMRLTEQLDAHQAMSEGLKQTIRNQIDVFTKLVVTHEIYSLNSRMKFDELFEKTYSINHPDQSFWSGIRTYADSQYNEIITKSLKAHPNLRDVDIHFLCLYCCDLPTSAIMACMGYREAHSVYNKKLRLAKAMGLSVQLDEYIRQFKQGE